jgi:cytochrome c553
MTLDTSRAGRSSPASPPSLPRLRDSPRRGKVGTGGFLAAAFVASALILMAAPASQAAGDAAAGRQKALACQTCHGLDGLSKLPEAPNLAGQPAPYLAKALDDYRTGARKNDMMSLVAPALSDQDVADLAAYYAGIEIEVKAEK